MSNLDANANLLRESLLRAFFMNMERGRTGKLDPTTGVPYDNPAEGLATNKIWVRVGATTRTDAGRELRVVKNLNTVTMLSADRPVLLWRNFDREWEVFGLDPTYADRELGGAIAAAQGDGPPPEVNKTLISRRNLLDFRPRVGDAGGLQMYVASGRYGGGKAWAGGNVTLVPTATAGNFAYVVVGFDEATGALVQALGPDYADAGSAVEADIAATFAGATFADARPIAAVLLANDATSFTNGEIVDIRDLTAVGNGSGTDANALHGNVAGEINALTEKAAPASADMLVIEDSADTYNKKKVQIGNLPGSGGGSGTHVELAYQELALAGTFATVDLTAISGGTTYDDLIIQGELRSTVSALFDVAHCYFNGDAVGGNYYYGLTVGGSGSFNGAGAAPLICEVSAGTAAAGTYAHLSAFLPAYRSSRQKGMDTRSNHQRAATTVYVEHVGTYWNNTAAIDTIDIATDGGDNFAAGSWIRVIGVTY